VLNNIQHASPGGRKCDMEIQDIYT